MFPLWSLVESQVFGWELQRRSGQQFCAHPCSTQLFPTGWKHVFRCLVEGEWNGSVTRSTTSWMQMPCDVGCRRKKYVFIFISKSSAFPLLFLSWPLSCLCLGDERNTSLCSADLHGGQCCSLAFQPSRGRRGRRGGWKKENYLA